MAYYINSECGINLRADGDNCIYWSVKDSQDVTISGSCSSNVDSKGDYYTYYIEHSPNCYLSDAYNLNMPINTYNSYIALAGSLFGWAIFAIVLYTFSFMGRK